MGGELRRGPKVVAVGALPPPIHGLSKAFQLLVDGARARGWDVVVIDAGDRTGHRNASFTIRRAVAMAGVVSRCWARLVTRDLLYLTVAHSKVGFARDALMIWWAALLGRKIVLHHHGGNYDAFFARSSPWLQRIIRSTLRQARSIIVLGESLRREMELVVGDPARIEVVFNASDVPRLPARAAPVGRLRVLYLSNLMVEKGYLDVLDAAPAVHEALPGWRIELQFAGRFLPGGGDHRDEAALERDFRERARRAGCEVTWHGVVQGEAKLALLTAADVFVLPTYYEGEGQPIAVIEALRSALPVVATAFRSIPEILPSEMEGLCVPPRDPAAIAERLVRLARDPVLYERVSRAAADRGERYGPEAHLSSMEALLGAGTET